MKVDIDLMNNALNSFNPRLNFTNEIEENGRFHL